MFDQLSGTYISSGQCVLQIEVFSKENNRSRCMHFFKDQRLCPYILRETFEKSNQNISRLLSHRKMYMTSKISTPSIKTFIMDFYEVIFYEEEQLLCSYDSPGRCSLQFPQAQAPVQCKFFLYFLVKGWCKFLNVV